MARRALRERKRSARPEGGRLFVVSIGRWFGPLIPDEKQYALFLTIDDGRNGAVVWKFDAVEIISGVGWICARRVGAEMIRLLAKRPRRLRHLVGRSQS